ncbi:hypothetical protein HYX19_01635 [Candidatus Woesearchaeota archaeon]|nr:hypothetical protein [Candidatus Woesearchaeota archaeon]
MKTKTKVGLALGVISSSVLVASLILPQKEKTLNDYANCLNNKRTYSSPHKESDLVPFEENKFVGIAFKNYRLEQEEAIRLLKTISDDFEVSPQDSLLFKVKVPKGKEVSLANKLDNCLFEIVDYTYIGYNR